MDELTTLGAAMNASRFDLFFTNIPDRGLVGTFETLADAMAHGKRLGFEFHIRQGGRLVGSWSVFGGWRPA